MFVEGDRVLVAGDLVMMGLPQFTAPSARFAATYRTFLTTVRGRAAALKTEGKSADDTLRVLQDQLQGRCNRGQMASAVRAAYNEAQ